MDNLSGSEISCLIFSGRPVTDVLAHLLREVARKMFLERLRRCGFRASGLKGIMTTEFMVAGFEWSPDVKSFATDSSGATRAERETIAFARFSGVEFAARAWTRSEGAEVQLFIREAALRGDAHMVGLFCAPITRIAAAAAIGFANGHGAIPN